MMGTQGYEVTKITDKGDQVRIDFLNPTGYVEVSSRHSDIRCWRSRGLLMRTDREPGEEVLKVGEPVPVSIRPKESEPASRNLDNIEM